VAQTKRKRRRKHRGTKSGRIDRRGSGRPRSREQARAQAKRRAEGRRDLPPTWGQAFRRGLVGAGIFFALMMIAFKQPLASALVLSVLMLGMYVPLGYYVDSFFWRRRRAAAAKR
jgi:hypothetical protein